jgi:hypothetical protein
MRKLVLTLCVLAVMSVSAGAYASATNWVMLIKASATDYSYAGTATTFGVYTTAQAPSTATWPTTAGSCATAVKVGGSYYSKYITAAGLEQTYDLKVGARGEYPYQNLRLTLWNPAADAANRESALDTNLVFTLYQGDTLAAWFSTGAHRDDYRAFASDRWFDVSVLMQPKGWNPGPIATGFFLDMPAVTGNGFYALADYSFSATPYRHGDPITPEPGSLLVLGSGLIGMTGFAIRRRRA